MFDKFKTNRVKSNVNVIKEKEVDMSILRIKFQNELNSLEQSLKSTIKDAYPNINITELHISTQYDSYSFTHRAWVEIKYICKYEYGPKSYIISNIIYDEINKVMQKYYKLSNENFGYYEIKSDVNRIYPNDLILQTGAKYIKCCENKCVPYNLGTMKVLNVKIGDTSYTIYSLVMKELDEIDNITPEYNNEEEK